MAKLDLSKIRATLERVPAQFADKSVKVGWFEGARYADGTPVAYVAVIQENGAPARGIPPRPLLKPAKAARQGAWTKTMSAGALEVLFGQASAEQVLDQVGMQAQSDIQAQIEATADPPLSPVTLLLRK